jgi:hypothetical protein
MFTKPKVTQSMIDAVNEALKGDQHKIDMNKNKKIDDHDFELLRNKKEVKEELKGDQHKIDKNKNNKIDSQDFDILRKQKKETYGEEAIARIIETSHLAKLRKEKAVEEEININVRTKDTLVGQRPTKQKDDVGPGADGKSTKVKFHGGPSSANEEVETKSKDEPPFTPDPVKKNPSAKAGKFGVQFSVARHLAKQGMKQAMKPVKEESLTAGKRLISKHGEGEHTTRVYKDTEYNEYQVHHFKDGKHMGEGPVSYHDDKEDAQSTAEHSLKKRMGEEVEQIDELSTNTLKSYHNKALKDMKAKGEKLGMRSGTKKDWKRIHGMETAKSKMYSKGVDPFKEEVESVTERTLSEPETQEKERIVKGMKKGLQGFKQRYGERAKSVMYATATKLAKEETVQEGENTQVKGGDPCWKGYQMVGMKNKGGKKVPNCVPEETQCDTPMNRTTKIAKAAFEAIKDRTKVK